MTAWYFGCRGSAGHFLFGPGPDPTKSLTVPDGFPWEHVDGVLTPGHRDRRGRLTEVGRQSRAAIRRKDGWTVLAVHDFTIDGRPGSNVAFIYDEDLKTADLLVRVSRDFPADVARITASEGLLIVEDDPVSGRLYGALKMAREKLCVAQTDVTEDLHRAELNACLRVIDRLGVFYEPDRWSKYDEPPLPGESS